MFYSRFLIIIISLSIFFEFTGCCKDPLPPDPPLISKDSTLLKSLVWANAIISDSLRYDAEKIIYSGNNVYYTNVGSSAGTSIFQYNSIDGKLGWIWHPSEVGGLFRDLENSNGIFVANFGTGLAGINEEDGKSIWEQKLNNRFASTGLKIIGDYAYFSRKNEAPPFQNSTNLERVNIYSGEIEAVLTISKDDFDGFSPSIDEVEAWIHPGGDTMAVFHISGLDGDNPGAHNTRLYAYNLNGDSIYYQVDSVDHYAMCNFRSPVIHENYAFFNGGHTTYCYDLLNKKQVWASDWPGFEGTQIIANTSTKPAVVWPYVVINPDSEDILCLDAHDGDLIWKIEDSSANTSDDMMYYKGHVYFTCFGDGKLYAINVQTGDEVWKNKSPFEVVYDHPTCNFTYENVAINEEEGLIYCHDEVFAMCFKAIE